MTNHISKIAAVSVLATALAGCNTANIKEDASAFGNKLSEALGQTFSMTINNKKYRLTGNDEKAVNASAQEALRNGSSTIKGDAVSGEMKVKSTSYETRNMSFATVKDIDKPVGMRMLNKMYEVTSASVNVRVGATTQKPIITRIKAGQKFNVLGTVEDGKWYVLSKNNTAFGYVFHTLMKEVPEDDFDISFSDEDIASLTPEEKAEAVAKAEAKPKEEVFDLDNEEIFENVELTVIQAETECKEVESTLNSDAASGVETFKACQNDKGVWEL